MHTQQQAPLHPLLHVVMELLLLLLWFKKDLDICTWQLLERRKSCYFAKILSNIYMFLILVASLTHHHTSCIAHKQSSIFRVLMPSRLPFILPSLAQTWITSLYIIDAFHLGLPRPYSYHHIPYTLHVEVLCDLRIPLVQLVVNPSNLTTWHAFLFFHSWCSSCPPWDGEKGHQEMCTRLCQYMVGKWETL